MANESGATIADLLAAGVCYDDAISAVDAEEAGHWDGPATSYEAAVTRLESWVEATGRTDELEHGLEWIRAHFNRDTKQVEMTPPIPYSSRSKFGSGRGNGAYGIEDGSQILNEPRPLFDSDRDTHRGYARRP